MDGNVSLVGGHFENAEHCVCCGAVIPEGSQVCIICEGLIMSNEKHKCKYCGHKSYTSNNICSACYVKLGLVRKLLKMVKDTFEMYGKGESK